VSIARARALGWDKRSFRSNIGKPGMSGPLGIRIPPIRGQIVESPAMDTAKRAQMVVAADTHITSAAALAGVELAKLLGAALKPSYRGGTWFESTAAHHLFDLNEAPITWKLVMRSAQHS
jgi:hypothetical protein